MKINNQQESTMLEDRFAANSPIEITMLGGFSIKIGDQVLTDDTGRTKQLWTLLEYLIANRHNDISQEHIIETLWDDEECDNPSNALKNLVYRLRTQLGALCRDEKYEFILFKRNVYSFNNTLPCVIDTEELETLFQTTKSVSLTDDEKLNCYLRAIDLYKGDFLPKSSMEDWVVAYSSYYKNIFTECVKNAAKILMEKKEYEQALLICNKAASKEPFDESMHELIINALLLSGNRQKAVEHYEFVSDLFYEKLGVTLSDHLRSMIREIIKGMNDVEKDLDVIKADLREPTIDSAFLCDYEIFRNIYHIEARLAERFGQSVFVALLTLEPCEKMEPQMIANTMQLLKSIILKSLRKSDVVSRFSSSQYILMLPSLTYENGQIVLNRILKKFNDENNSPRIRLGTKLNPLSPVTLGT